MSIGKLPSSWKTAVVSPLYKKGISSNPSNYRPISKTSIFCKLMEKTLVYELTNYLTEYNLLNSNQHGFRHSKSTMSNLLETLSHWTYNLDNKTPTTAVMFDFRKAFDSVSHPKLLAKLTAYGISGNLHLLIQDFLSNRTQVTKIGTEKSNLLSITSGVIQGSCLGPILFLLFVNDLPDSISHPTLSKVFVDDFKIFSKVGSLYEEFKLQCNINKSSPPRRGVCRSAKLATQ